MADVKIEGFDHIIREAVQKRIEASIAESLDGERDGIVERIVAHALNAKVKERGGYRDIPFLENLARETIQDATKEVVTNWVRGLVPEIQAEIEKILATKKAQRELASALIGQLVSIADRPSWKIDVSFKEPTRD